MKVIIAVATALAALPGTAASVGISIALTQTNGSPVVDASGANVSPVTATASPYQAEFDNIPAGSYVAVASAVDATGAVIGSAVSTPFTVPVASNYDAPQSITVTVA